MNKEGTVRLWASCHGFLNQPSGEQGWMGENRRIPVKQILREKIPRRSVFFHGCYLDGMPQIRLLTPVRQAFDGPSYPSAGLQNTETGAPYESGNRGLSKTTPRAVPVALSFNVRNTLGVEIPHRTSGRERTNGLWLLGRHTLCPVAS
jgi:hypothetical protein